MVYALTCASTRGRVSQASRKHSVVHTDERHTVTSRTCTSGGKANAAVVQHTTMSKEFLIHITQGDGGRNGLHHHDDHGYNSGYNSG
eukprot:4213746-Pyramimonas_sp.AAC.2